MRNLLIAISLLFNINFLQSEDKSLNGDILISMVRIDNKLDEMMIDKNIKKLSEIENSILDLERNLKDILLNQKINIQKAGYFKFIDLYSKKINLKLKKISKTFIKPNVFRYTPTSNKTSNKAKVNLLEINQKNEESQKKLSTLIATSENIKSLSRILYSINKP